MRGHGAILRISFWLCALMPWLSSAAAPREHTTRLWQMEDGLPHNIVQAIAQTSDGYLWVGTREGLARFDGMRFQAVDLLPESSEPSVLSLLAGSDGSLWIGTETRGVFRLQRGELKACDTSGGTRDFTVTEMAEGADKVVWFASTNGLYRWQDNRLERQPEFRSVLKSLCVDTNGAVWEISNAQLTCLDGTATNRMAIKSGTLPSWVRAIYCDRAGVFWVSAGNDAGNGLLRLEDGVVTSFPKASGPAGIISAMMQDGAGRLWIGSRAGLGWFEDGKFISQGGADGPAYRIHAIFEDRERNIWVGSEEGLSRLTPKTFKTITKRDGLSLDMVVSVCPDSSNGVWISSWGGGLNHWVDGEINVLRKTGGLSSDFIMAMTRGRDGSLWAGADYGAALNQIKDDEIVQYGSKQGFVSNMGGPTIAMHEDENGVLWIGTMEGLQCWDGRRFTRPAAENSPGRIQINALCGSSSNAFWIGTEKGLMRMSGGRLERLANKDGRLQKPVLSLYEDSARTLWIGTSGSGLLRWKDGALDQLTGEQGLSSDTIYSVLEDDRGQLWLNGSRGVFSVQKKQIDAVVRSGKQALKSVSYGRADGIASSGQYRDAIQPSACKSADGRLWFRTTQGVVVVDPDAIDANELPPPVVISEVIADKKIVGASGLRLEVARQIVIPPGRGELEIHYAALSFRAAEKNQYRYRLEGVDLEWVEAGTRSVAFYNNLRPGHYRFHVSACNNDGVWNETGAHVELTLEPHFWQTAWFLAIVGVAAVLAIGGSARYVTRRRMQQKLERLKQQHAIEMERARIARDMHDELGAKLTRISFDGATASRRLANPAEAEQHIARMTTTARELVLSLDQIVWAVDPENDSLENLTNYICRYASEFLEKSSLECEFVIPTELPARRLPTDVRHNVFLAVKEILNNALKHSGATKVVLTISARDEEFVVGIADDGRGMAAGEDVEVDKTRRVGHGLKNLRERLASIGGRCELKSEPGRGTEFRLVVPLPRLEDDMSSVYPTRGIKL